MKVLAPAMILSAFLAGAPAFAAEAGPPSPLAAALPEDHLARQALEASPAVEKAKAELQYARAGARALAAGEHEFVVTGAALNRNVRGEQSYPEFSLDLARGVRLPGKAALDRTVGDLGAKAAEDSVDDARHQTALRLADAWFAWVEASAQIELDRATVASAGAEVAALRRRVELKDAALLDLEQAQAAQSAAASRLSQAEGAFEAARLSLVRGFPELPLPATAPVFPSPPGLGRTAAQWRDTVLSASHEISIADYLARQAEAQAARARLDRRPDPTIGLRAFSERGGREQGLGVYVSTPLGGPRRTAAADAQTARASAARADLFRVRREVEELAAKDVAAATFAEASWESAATALESGRAAGRRVRRGFELGERDLTEVLLAERQVYDAQRLEIAARVGAWRALTRLHIDAHVLWGDDDAHGDHAPVDPMP